MLIDRRNHHTFQPLLYQVALAALSPGDIAQPIRSIFRNRQNVDVLMDEVVGIDASGKISPSAQFRNHALRLSDFGDRIDPLLFWP